MRKIACILTAAALAAPSAAAASSDPLESVKNCQKEIGYTVAALIWGEWQSPDCP